MCDDYVSAVHRPTGVSECIIIIAYKIAGLVQPRAVSSTQSASFCVMQADVKMNRANMSNDNHTQTCRCYSCRYLPISIEKE